jgi:hypothetical protein
MQPTKGLQMRIRTIKPEFFTHEGLFDLEKESGLPVRVAFTGLWCAADRSGRFKWEPRRLGISILPYDELDFSRVMHALLTRGFIVKYRVGAAWFGAIPSWSKHQIINNRETASTIPDVTVAEEVDASVTREARVDHADEEEGKGKEGKGKEGSLVGISPPSPSGEIPVAHVVAEYHDLCPSLPRVSKMTDVRSRMLKARWNDAGPNPLEWFQGLFRKAEASDFISGRNGKWTAANFDWLISPSNCVKVLEGNYDNRAGNAVHGKVSSMAG